MARIALRVTFDDTRDTCNHEKEGGVDAEEALVPQHTNVGLIFRRMAHPMPKDEHHGVAVRGGSS